MLNREFRSNEALSYKHVHKINRFGEIMVSSVVILFCQDECVFVVPFHRRPRQQGGEPKIMKSMLIKVKALEKEVDRKPSWLTC